MQIIGYQPQFDDGNWSCAIYTEAEAKEFMNSPRKTVIDYRAVYASSTREQLGEMIYRATYEHQGGMWRAVETKDFWYETADRLIALCVNKS